MVKLSIIIPIYNVELYIKNALDSVYNQGISDAIFEVVAVDDGTLDNSMAIVNSYKTKHKNLSIISQQNAGVSAARNRGIDISRGEWVVFLDADDTLAEGSLAKLIMHIGEGGSDDIIVMQSHLNDTEKYPFGHLLENKMTYSGEELYACGFSRGSVCGAGYKMSFIRNHNIRFAEGVTNAEDTLFWGVCQALNARISFYQERFYEILGREGSAFRHLFSAEELVRKSILALEAELNEQNSRNLEPYGRAILEELRYKIISNATYIAVNQGIQYGAWKKILSYNMYLPVQCKGNTVATNKIAILNFSPKLFYALSYLKYKVFRLH